MTLKGTSARYGRLAAGLHWASALLIVAVFALGLRAAGTDDPGAKLDVLRLHVIGADIVLLLTLTRLVWWAFDTRPRPIAGMPRAQILGSRAVHIALYGVLIVLFASGIGTLVLSALGPALFGGAMPDPFPDLWQFPPRTAHWLAGLGLLALLVLHVGAALHHHFIKRDGLLARMKVFD